VRARWAELSLSEHAFYFREYYGRRRALWDGGPPTRLPFLSLDQVTPRRALDAGCGVGRDTIALAGKGWDTTGLDLSARAIAQARRRAPGLRFVLGTATAIGDPPLEGPFDLVLDVFGPASDLSAPKRALYAERVRRVLSPGGLFAIFSFERAEALAPLFAPFAIDRELAARCPVEPSGRWWLLRQKG